MTYEKLPESSDIMKTESQLPAQQYKLIYIHTALHPSTWSIVRDNPDILIKLSELYNCYIRQGPVSVSIPCNISTAVDGKDITHRLMELPSQAWFWSPCVAWLLGPSAA